MYTRALEQEVLRLKETCANSQRERDAIAEENRRLRELLSAHGIHYDFTATPIQFHREESGYGPSSSGSISGSYAPGSDSSAFTPPPPPVPPGMAPNATPTAAPSGPPVQSMAQLPNNQLDYDAIGIDFVLTYDSQGRPIPAPDPRAAYPSPPPQR